MMHRFPDGVAGEKVHQKRVPSGAPPWLETVRVFHPWNSRRADTERPDEWRIDPDPMPSCGYGTVRRVGPRRPRLSGRRLQMPASTMAPSATSRGKYGRP